MTRRLILIRHAKSSWSDPLLDDHDRPLNPRGGRSADAIGDWLRKNAYIPDQILCSTATRTRETCDRLAVDAPVTHLPELYHAGPDVMLAALRRAEGACVAMIGHNPGIGAFASMLVRGTPAHARFADYPTGATLVADFPVDDWADATMHTAAAVAFVVPRELIGD
ncbi:histidine phosphatase family protein [Pseudooceanicola sp. LIPI14-2-Ac024]|uniref:SixA phosphatase family protein n=1 Tax=Pseudooceanicola sp. LIPI14-2-Ac024 TaxID=3344875 RepID=UPI0035CF635C